MTLLPVTLYTAATATNWIPQIHTHKLLKAMDHKIARVPEMGECK